MCCDLGEVHVQELFEILFNVGPVLILFLQSKTRSISMNHGLKNDEINRLRDKIINKLHIYNIHGTISMLCRDKSQFYQYRRI